MSDLSPVFLWAVIAAVFVLGGFVKGIVGLGLPTITMGLLSIVMLPAQAATLLVLPSFITNLWQIRGPGFFALLRRIGLMLVGVCAGVEMGAGWLSGSGWTSAGLGAALIVYSAFGLLRWRFHVAARHEHWLGPLR